MSKKNMLVTGRPGVGKTTLVRKIVERLSESGVRCGGFYTEEIRKGEERVGFKIVTLDGREGVLARKGLESPFRLGKYGVNVKDIEEVAVSALKGALKEAEVVVIDEIAKMELFCPSFAPVVRDCLNSRKAVLATLQMKHLPFLIEVRSRPDVHIFTITAENREKLVEEVTAALCSLLTLVKGRV